MRTFDFAPFYRSTVGFDRVFSMLDQLEGGESSAASYPPYNIERTGENAYRISVAVAGFTEADLSVEAKENALTIRGEKQPSDTELRAADIRAQLPACRPCRRQVRNPGEWASKRRPSARGSRGHEASGDPDCELEQASRGKPNRYRGLTTLSATSQGR